VVIIILSHLTKNNDVKAATILPGVKGEEELDENWDLI
jgi:hypothetical protein